MNEKKLLQYVEQLGYEARDKITGLKGVITSVSFDVSGCIQYLLLLKPSEGKYPESYWLDVNRIEIFKKKRMECIILKNNKNIEDNGPISKPIK